MLQNPENTPDGGNGKRDTEQGKRDGFPCFANAHQKKVDILVKDLSRELGAKACEVPFNDRDVQPLLEQLPEILIRDLDAGIELKLFSVIKFTKANGRHCYLITVKPEDDENSYLLLDGGCAKATKGNVLIGALSSFEEPLKIDRLKELIEPNLFRKIQNDLVSDLGGRHAPNEMDLALPVFDQKFISPLTNRLFRVIDDECEDLSWRSLGPVANYDRSADRITVRVTFGYEERYDIVVEFKYDAISALLTTLLVDSEPQISAGLRDGRLPNSSAGQVDIRLQEQLLGWLEGRFAASLGVDLEKLDLSLSSSKSFELGRQVAFELASGIGCQELRPQLRHFLRSNEKALAMVVEAKEAGGDWVVPLAQGVAQANFGELKMLLLLKPGGHIACVPLCSRAALGEHLVALGSGRYNNIVETAVKGAFRVFANRTRSERLKEQLGHLEVRSVALDGDITLVPRADLPAQQMAAESLGCLDHQALRVVLGRKGEPESSDVGSCLVKLRRLAIPSVGNWLGVLNVELGSPAVG